VATFAIDQAISRFAALSLPAKVAEVARAVKRTEDHVREHDGQIGHPAEFPGDFATTLAAPCWAWGLEATFIAPSSACDTAERMR